MALRVVRYSSFDLDLWRRVKSASASEVWKWDWNVWSPIIAKIFAKESEIQDLMCPVCGEKGLYTFFATVDLVEKEQGLVFIGDRWFGCHSCKTQVRDRGEIPHWVHEEDIKWAIKKFKEQAEQKLGRKLKGEILFGTNLT